MKIGILCSDTRHPVYSRLTAWRDARADSGSIAIAERKSELGGGDILFLISCSEMIREEDRAKFSYVFVIHASDLPLRRGWSPHIWAILDGESEIVVTLLAARDVVDSGEIYAQRRFSVYPDQLLTEVNEALFAAEFDLIDWAIANFGCYQPREQVGEPSYCGRRTPDNSRIDPDAPISSQFDILRLADPERYPAFFDLYGQRYILTLKKAENPSDEHP
jgi:methionyl-tRNA formyltransferase